MTAFVEVMTLIWSAWWAWRAAVRLLRGDRNSLLVIYLFFFLEYAIPLGIDQVSGIPQYTRQHGFAVSSQDAYVRLIYCVFVLVVPPIWLWSTPSHRTTPFTPSPLWVGVMLRIGSFAPIYTLFIVPQPTIYLSYAGIMDSSLPLIVKVFHIIVSIATLIAVFCVAMRFLTTKLTRMMIAEAILAVAISIWLNGKRYILAEAIMLITLALWYRGILKGKRLVWAAVCGGVTLGTFSVIYEATIRDISMQASTRDAALDGARIDYTRDSRVRMAIYAELYPDKMQILEYRGQDLVYYATSWVPRVMWPGKPWSYANHFTNAMLNQYPKKLTWGMTTGVFDEAIASAGFLGIILGPLLVKGLCAFGDGARGWNTHVLTVLVGVLIMSVQLTAFMPMLGFWLYSIVTEKSGRRSRKYFALEGKVRA